MNSTPAPRRLASQRARTAVGCLATTLLLLAFAASPGCAAVGPAEDPAVSLRDGWHLRSSEGLEQGGAEISRPGFATEGWTAARVPTTVLAALVAAGEYPDPYHGRNLEAIPTARFAVPWWYRTELAVAEPLAVSSRLLFHGINYSAEVWLNGERIAGREQLTGAFRSFDLDVTAKLRPGANALAVRVYPPEPGDFTIGFVDWNPTAPDRNMGVWREVELRRTGAVSLEDVFVRSDFEGSAPATADLTLEARLVNRTDQPVRAALSGRIEGVGELRHELDLGPHEGRVVRLGPAEAAALRLRAPRLWWPNNMGEPHLYRLELEASALPDGGGDRQTVEFGVREVADYLDEKSQRGYTINGKPVLVRGGGWVDDLMLADSDQRLEDQILYARHLNLNTIRLEGFWGTTRKLYELADRHGLMVWVGWSCQWEWEDYLRAPVDETFGGVDTPAEMELVAVSLRDQVVRLRNHPSVVVWNLASDMLPHPDLERKYRALLAEIDPTRPPLAACSVRTSEVSGPSGVKMNGPYEWVPPDYWYVDTEHGGAYGFNTETGPGAQPPVVESIRRMMPRENWWPIDDMWDYHSGRNEFKSPARYVAALDARYGKSASLEEFARKAQVANYEAMRPMFEAFSVRRPDAKGVVQWMLNSAWPDLFWQLYDWYLVPTGAYYAARNANRPVHVVYDYGKREVVAVNDTGEPLRGAKVRLRAFDTASQSLMDETVPIDLAAESRRAVITVPPLNAGQDVMFLDLRIENACEEVSRNFYWLPPKPDVLDWANSKWFYTPTSEYADLTAVTKLPPSPLEVTHAFRAAGDGGQEVEVTLHNPGERIAFFVELAVLGAESGRLAAPVRWDDNYVSLLPGERRTLRAIVPPHALGGDRPTLRVQGMNVPAAGG